MDTTKQIAEEAQHANIKACTQATSNMMNGEKKNYSL